MIPKIIHYCWFGPNPIPELTKLYVKHWQEVMPDYQIMFWNEDNFDVNQFTFTKKAYKENHFAFVSDYFRLWVLYNYGGIYLDTDVQVIKSFDDLLSNKAFTGLEAWYELNDARGIAPGLCLGAEKNSKFLQNIMKLLDNNNINSFMCIFNNYLMQNNINPENNIIQKNSFITVYPTEYFCPKPYGSNNFLITNNTYSIHMYWKSW